MIEDEIEQFKAWKREKNKNELDDAFYELELSLSQPGSRQFMPIMPSIAYRTLAKALIALKKELIDKQEK